VMMTEPGSSTAVTLPEVCEAAAGTTPD